MHQISGPNSWINALNALYICISVYYFVFIAWTLYGAGRFTQAPGLQEWAELLLAEVPWGLNAIDGCGEFAFFELHVRTISKLATMHRFALILGMVESSRQE